MKKLYLTLCAMLLSIVAGTAIAQSLNISSNFYGQGYYRVVNLQTARMIEVVGDVVPQDNVMKSVNMRSFDLSDFHGIASSAGSVIAIKPTKSTDQFDGTWDMNAQGVGTYYLTGSNPLVQNLISMVAGQVPENSGIGVRIVESSDLNGINFGGITLNGKAYSAHVDLWDLQQFMSFRGMRRANFCDNGGRGSGGMTDLKDFALYAEGISPKRPNEENKTSWLLLPMDANMNYYTPTYSNSTGDGYVHSDGRNWATVFVDFPFHLPSGAEAYAVTEDGNIMPITLSDYDYIPSQAKLLLSWPADNATTDLHIIPGYLTDDQIAQCEADRVVRYNELAVEEVPEQMANQIQAMLMAALGQQQTYAFLFGDDYVGTPSDTELLNALRMKFSDLTKINNDLEGLINNVIVNQADNSDYQNFLSWYDEEDPDRQVKAAIIFVYLQFFGGNVTQSQKDNTQMMQYSIMLEINNSYLQARYDKSYNETYGVVYETEIAKEEGYRKKLNRNNGLLWCGDFFSYREGYSTQEGNAPSLTGIKSLSTVANDVASFDSDVTAWQGNVLYHDSEAHSLQWIVNNGSIGETYKVSDKLQVMYVYSVAGGFNPITGVITPGSFRLFVKDDDNFRLADKDMMSDGLIDYMSARYFTSVDMNDNVSSYADCAISQSNWIRIDCSDATMNNVLPDIYNQVSGQSGSPVTLVTKSIVPKLTYVKDVMLTLRDKQNPTADLVSLTYLPEDYPDNVDQARAYNTYIPASFYEEDGQATCRQNGFFFAAPKPNEVAIVSWSVYDGAMHMYMPKKGPNPNNPSEMMNVSDLKGGYPIVKDYYPASEALPFESGQAYEYFALITKKSTSSHMRRSSSYTPVEYDDAQISSVYEVHPIYAQSYDPTVIVTDVEHVSAQSEVTGTEYVNLAGQRSLRPWAGVNIVVTRYSDGTTRSAKAIF